MAVELYDSVEQALIKGFGAKLEGELKVIGSFPMGDVDPDERSIELIDNVIAWLEAEKLYSDVSDNLHIKEINNSGVALEVDVHHPSGVVMQYYAFVMKELEHKHYVTVWIKVVIPPEGDDAA